MSVHAPDDPAVLARQMGRMPRTPWHVAARCSGGRPTVIVSPPLLDGGTRYPDYAWLTCPVAISLASAAESRGEAAVWRDRLTTDPELRERLDALDQHFRALRTEAGKGVDPCADVGIAGERDPANVKCLHAHVALTLIGLDDPIGRAVLTGETVECGDPRCSTQCVPAEETPTASLSHCGAAS